ncbi:peptidase [Mesorhizobium huakuii]|uniref:SprT-like domain-containing protein n=1 Tax=Mesorhizobium TaxID=68287 RepID=UPI00049A32B4|nr:MULTISPECIES: SprT-like domain-containing protein [Mesorhizobium]AID28402.1 sprT domain-containing protein [Mesorhizobium huakuii 7653R]MCH4559004.1 SprT-like domain-containing protein [Mesorhizobium jarvisii]GLQ80662.1 peptidase [Mesorhizobium huakuii]
MSAINPTTTTYEGLNRAYGFFNERLFGGTLPPCLITMQRKAKAHGYFAGGRFGSKDGAVVTDEIALNPSHFHERSTEQSLSTLVHEMVHLWQHHFGKVSRGGYHNAEWATKMKEIGLVPSDTGQPGGKQTGQRVSHYIADGGAYRVAFVELEASGFDALYVELWAEGAGRAKRKAKNASKSRYTCPDCGLNAWAKPAAPLICGDCGVRMKAPEGEGEEEEAETELEAA